MRVVKFSRPSAARPPKCFDARAAGFIGVVLCLVGSFPIAAQEAPSEKGAQNKPGPGYDAALDEGLRLYSEGKFREAGDKLVQVLQSYPNAKEAHYWLGLARFETKQWEESRAAFQKFCELAPENPEARRWVGDTYMQERLYAPAIAWFEKALALNPTDIESKDKLEQARKGLASSKTMQAPPKAEESTGANVAGLANPPAKQGTPVAAPPEANEKKAQPWLATGLVGAAGPQYYWWLTAAGIFLMLFIWGTIFSSCVAKFRPPLTNDEMAKSILICIVVLLCFLLVWWGYLNISWRGWLLFAWGCWILSGNTTNRAKQLGWF